MSERVYLSRSSHPISHARTNACPILPPSNVHVLSGVPEGRTRGTRMQSHLSRLASRLTAAAAMLAVATITQAAEKRVIYVDKSAPPGGDGTSWETAFSDLRVALNASRWSRVPALEYRIAQGVYTPDIAGGNRGTMFESPVLSSAADLSILGSFAGLAGPDPDRRDYVSTRTVLSGDLNGDDGPDFTNRGDNSTFVARFFTYGNMLIDGLTIRGASADGSAYSAQGLHAYARPYPIGPRSVVLTMSSCIVEENDGASASAGGASLFASYVGVIDVEFRNNRNRNGTSGGLYIRGLPGAGTVLRCRFVNNQATYGGAAYLEETEVLQSIFVDNSATFQGGAYFGNGPVSSSLFARNRAGFSGGAIAGRASSVTSCTFVDNEAPSGSAISTFNASPWITSSIFWNNRAAAGAPTIEVSQSIWEAGLIGVVLQGGTAQASFTGTTPVIADVIDQDPQFIRPFGEPGTDDDWRSWNYRLRLGSPAIGAGARYFAAVTDLDGSSFDQYPNLQKADAGCYFITRSDCFADLDRSWPFLVDDSDFQLFAAAYDLTIAPPANPLADLNNDGIVDDADFSLFAVAYDALVCP